MGRIVWLTCLIGPLGLPATFLITQNAMPVKFSILAWVLAALMGLTSLAPLWSWRRKRDQLTIWLGAATVCGQLVVLLLCAVPQVAAGLSARDLAEYLNRNRNLPARMLMAQERIGSLVFYLDGDLRSRLQIGQMANQDIDDPLPSPPLPSSPGDVKEWIVIPERHLHTALNDYDILPLPCERAGRFRIYQRSDVEPRALISTSHDSDLAGPTGTSPPTEESHVTSPALQGIPGPAGKPDRRVAIKDLDQDSTGKHPLARPVQ
jgi:hypothetical protein